MKTHYSILAMISILIICLSSCTMEKRVHRNGYYIESKMSGSKIKKHQNDTKEITVEKTNITHKVDTSDYKTDHYSVEKQVTIISKAEICNLSPTVFKEPGNSLIHTQNEEKQIRKLVIPHVFKKTGSFSNRNTCQAYHQDISEDMIILVCLLSFVIFFSIWILGSYLLSTFIIL